MPTLEFRRAICEALDEELERDPSVIFFGEDVGAAGGVFAVTGGLQERHGAARVFDTPISELAIAGAAFGAAVGGMRPVIEIMFGDFLFLAMDSLVNQAAKYWYISAEQASIPLVVRSAVGAGGRFGAIHSQMPAPWFQGIPGLKVVAPSTPGDAKALLKAAIRDPNPVVFLEHKRLYSIKEEVAGDGPETEPLGAARVVREGRDLTVATASKSVHDALAAAETLAGDGVAAGGHRPAHAATAGPRHGRRIGEAHQPADGGGGGPAHRWVVGGGARRLGTGRPGAPRRRLAADDARHAHPL